MHGPHTMPTMHAVKIYSMMTPQEKIGYVDSACTAAPKVITTNMLRALNDMHSDR